MAGNRAEAGKVGGLFCCNPAAVEDNLTVGAGIRVVEAGIQVVEAGSRLVAAAEGIPAVAAVGILAVAAGRRAVVPGGMRPVAVALEAGKQPARWQEGRRRLGVGQPWQRSRFLAQVFAPFD